MKTGDLLIRISGSNILPRIIEYYGEQGNISIGQVRYEKSSKTDLKTFWKENFRVMDDIDKLLY